MNRSGFALFVAIVIHLKFLFLLFWLNDFFEKKPLEKKVEISLKTLKLKESKLSIVESRQIKKIVKNPKKLKQKVYKKYEPKKPRKKITLNKTKDTVEKIVKKIKKEIPRTKPQKEDPFSYLLEDFSKNEQKVFKSQASNKSRIDQDILELYGETFQKLSNKQQKYILDNQEIMRRITQKVLTRVASVNLSHNLNVNKNNIIEFYLHPNGDMSDFKFLEKSGLFILDKTTKETIGYAYSKYPKPKEKTLIRYNVYYYLKSYY